MGMKEGESVPEGCDCCGHDAEDCGMLDAGWVRDAQLVAGGGVYCRACAHLLRLVRLNEECVWCNVPMVEVTVVNKITGFSIGMVSRVNRARAGTPSMRAAS